MNDVTISFTTDKIIAQSMLEIYTILDSNNFGDVDLDSFIFPLREWSYWFPVADPSGETYEYVSPHVDYDHFIKVLESVTDRIRQSKEYRAAYLKFHGIGNSDAC